MTRSDILSKALVLSRGDEASLAVVDCLGDVCAAALLEDAGVVEDAVSRGSGESIVVTVGSGGSVRLGRRYDILSVGT